MALCLKYSEKYLKSIYLLHDFYFTHRRNALIKLAFKDKLTIKVMNTGEKDLIL